MIARPAVARCDSCHYELPWLPPELATIAGPARRRGADRTGQIGLLELTAAHVAGATRLVHHFQQTPLQIFRSLSLDPARPAMAFIFVAQTGGGILQGDRYRLDLVCRPGAEVHLTTQAATKIYRMDQNHATQLVNLIAEDDAIVEYLPDPIIPFRGARFCQQLRMTVAPTATVIAGEILLPGRVAHGERHAYTLFSSRTEARRPDGRLLFTDLLTLCPAVAAPNSPGLLGPYDVVGTLFILSRRIEPRSLAACLSEALADQQAVLAAAGELPNACGVVVRILGQTSAAVQSAMRFAWNEARIALLGSPAPDLRKG